MKNWFLNKRKKFKLSEEKDLINSAKVSSGSKLNLIISNNNSSASTEDGDIERIDSNILEISSLLMQNQSQRSSESLNSFFSIDSQINLSKSYEQMTRHQISEMMSTSQQFLFKDLQQLQISRALQSQLLSNLNEQVQKYQINYLMNQNIVRVGLLSPHLPRNMLADSLFLRPNISGNNSQNSTNNLMNFYHPNSNHVELMRNPSSYKFSVNKNFQGTIHPLRVQNLNNGAFGFFPQ